LRENGDEGYIYYMSINKKIFNKIALADGINIPPGMTPEQVHELIKRMKGLEIMKPSGPTPKPGITPSIPGPSLDPACADVFAHMRSLSSIREITQYFMQALGELRSRSENFCSSGGQESNFEGFIDALQGFLCVVKYITKFIPGSTMPTVLTNLLKRLRPLNGLDHLDDNDMSFLYAMLCLGSLVDQIVLLDETYDEKSWEDLFNIIKLIPQPQPIVCPKPTQPTREDAEALLDGVLGTTGQILSDDAREELIVAILAIMISGATLAAVIAGLFASGVAAAEIGVMALYGFALAIWAAIEDWCSDDDEEIKGAPHTVEV